MPRAERSPSGSAAASAGATASPPRAQLRVPDAPTSRDATQSQRVNPVIATEPWTLLGREGRMLTTPHYRVFSTVEDARLESRTPRFLEFALQHYTSGLAPLPMPTAPMDTYVLGTRPQWQAITRRIAGRNAATYLRIQRGGYAFSGRGVYWDIGPSDTLSLAAHEGWHQFTQSTFRNPLPSWLEEGIACYMEGFRWHPVMADTPNFLPWANTERFDILRRAVAAKRTLPLDELMSTRVADLVNSSGDGTLIYYGQAWALVHFLVEGENGRFRDAFAALLQDAASGTMYGNLATRLGDGPARSAALRRRGPEVFLAYFDDDLESMNASFEAFMARIVRTGGRDAVVAGR
ncbi:MAG: DUF1570 domain-containing protein, partial [Planctomycetota bacterium]